RDGFVSVRHHARQCPRGGDGNGSHFQPTTSSRSRANLFIAAGAWIVVRNQSRLSGLAEARCAENSTGGRNPRIATTRPAARRDWREPAEQRNGTRRNQLLDGRCRAVG